MPDKVLEVSRRRGRKPRQPLSENSSRVIFHIGGRRLAFDFTSTVSELKPRPAEVIPIAEGRNKQAARATVRTVPRKGRKGKAPVVELP